MKDAELGNAEDFARAALDGLKNGSLSLGFPEAPGLLVIFALPNGDTAMASNIQKADVVCALEAILVKLKKEQN